MEQRRVLTIFLAIVLCSSIGITRQTFANSQNAHIIKEVRHELATLPYYGVFDWLEFEVRPDNTVVLRGQVVRPTTKSDAESRVKDVEGVSRSSTKSKSCRFLRWTIGCGGRSIEQFTAKIRRCSATPSRPPLQFTSSSRMGAPLRKASWPTRATRNWPIRGRAVCRVFST